jgi:hypothetical protein
MNADIGSLTQRLIIVFIMISNNMSFQSNNGSFYYEIPCGVPSESGLNLDSNNGTQYFYRESNDFILWGQNVTYPQPSTNNGTQYYFHVCVAPTDENFSPTANNGSSFYYSPEFNCVSFCENVGPTPDVGFVFVFNDDNFQIFDHLDQAVQVSEEFANS